jgi:Leucine-rich repeat (LRR) protein
MKSLVITILSLSLFALTGCDNDSDDPPAPSNTARVPHGISEPPVVEPDDSLTIDALKALGAKFKANSDGQITEVSLIGCPATDDDLQQLSKLSKLTSVRLNETQITDAGLETIGLLSNLTNLDLRGCGVSNTGIKHLVGLSKLRALRLSGESGVTTVDDGALADIGKLTNLKALLLDHLWVGENLPDLAPLQNLEELYLAKTLIDDTSLAALKQHPKLKKIRISQTQITDAGIEQLTALTNLTDLDLSENSVISDVGMSHLSKITTLTKLNLWRVALSDSGIEQLAGLVNMQWLNLDNTSLSDRGLIHLQGMKEIQFLHLGSTTITDAGLPHLAGLTTLKDLKVTRTAVTAEGVAALKEKLPTTEIQLKYLP